MFYPLTSLIMLLLLSSITILLSPVTFNSLAPLVSQECMGMLHSLWARETTALGVSLL